MAPGLILESPRRGLRDWNDRYEQMARHVIAITIQGHMTMDMSLTKLKFQQFLDECNYGFPFRDGQ